MSKESSAWCLTEQQEVVSFCNPLLGSRKKKSRCSALRGTPIRTIVEAQLGGLVVARNHRAGTEQLPGDELTRLPGGECVGFNWT